MDTGIARPPLPSYTAITPETRAPERTAPAAKTELPVTQTVTPAQDPQASRLAAEEATKRESAFEANRPRVDRKNIIDPESKSVIYIATDSDSGEIVRQFPSETLLKLRAYAQSVTEQAEKNASEGVERTI